MTNCNLNAFAKKNYRSVLISTSHNTNVLLKRPADRCVRLKYDVSDLSIQKNEVEQAS